MMLGQIGAEESSAHAGVLSYISCHDHSIQERRLRYDPE
jgi:hypothetical protein